MDEIRKEEDVIKIALITTDKCCYVSDCFAKQDSYDYNYHHSKIEKLLFDGELPVETFAKNWYRISKHPICVEREHVGETKNDRYEIKDKKFVSDEFPAVVKGEDWDTLSSEARSLLYDKVSDPVPPYRTHVRVEIEEILEVDNFVEPIDFNFKAVHKFNYEDRVYNVTSANVKHSMIDQIILPSVLLQNTPCSLSSKEVYDITRQYIRENINLQYAKITSDYDFCFEVKKMISLLEPETLSYQNIFARTKKERSKTHFVTKELKEVKIFEMTSDRDKYQRYTVVPGITADNELQLKEKIDEWLSTIITKINEPWHLCEHCKGTGYKDDK